MTYCLGWKNRNDIFVVADSAVTFTNDSANKLSHTSFGEVTVKCNNTEISESITKIHDIDNKLIIGYAGNIDNALKCIEYIRKLVISEGDSIDNALHIISRYTDIINDVALIVGFFDSGIAKLCKVEDGNIEFVENLVEIGSIPTSHNFSNKIRWMINRGSKKFLYDGKITLTNREILQAIIITAQCYSIKYRLMDYGVGGVFYGAKLTKEGFYRNENISYMITNKEPQYTNNELAGIDYSDFITTNWIDDILVVSSTVLDRPIALFDNFDFETNKYILESLEYNCNEEMFSIKTEQLVLFNPFTEMITAIDIKKEIYNNFFKLWSKSENDLVHYFFVYNMRIINIINFAQFDYEDEVLLNWLLVSPQKYMTRKNFLVSIGAKDKIKDWDDEGYI